MMVGGDLIVTLAYWSLILVVFYIGVTEFPWTSLKEVIQEWWNRPSEEQKEIDRTLLLISELEATVERLEKLNEEKDSRYYALDAQATRRLYNQKRTIEAYETRTATQKTILDGYLADIRHYTKTLDEETKVRVRQAQTIKLLQAEIRQLKTKKRGEKV